MSPIFLECQFNFEDNVAVIAGQLYHSRHSLTHFVHQYVSAIRSADVCLIWNLSPLVYHVRNCIAGPTRPPAHVRVTAGWELRVDQQSTGRAVFSVQLSWHADKQTMIEQDTI